MFLNSPRGCQGRQAGKAGLRPATAARQAGNSRVDTPLLRRASPLTPGLAAATLAARRPVMVKLFQGDVQSVQNDVNSWIEVYKPAITDFKQSLIVLEHNIIVLLSFLYEARSETGKVEYKFDRYKK
jgi:hypothetical protein